MTLAEADTAAREAATAVSMVECPTKGWWNRPCPGADFNGVTVCVVPHHYSARVARQAAGRFRRNARPTFEDRLTRRVGIDEDRSVNVDDDLVALTRRTGMDTVVERGLGEQCQGIRLLLGHRGRFLGQIRNRGSGMDTPRLLIKRLARCLERLHEHRALLGCEPTADDNHTVFVLIHLQRPALVAAGFLTRLGDPIDPPPAPDDPLDVVGAAGPAYRQ